MSNSALALPWGLKTGIFIPIQCGATWAPGSRNGGGLSTAELGPGLLGPGPWASSAPLVRGPGSCPHFLPFLAPALGAGGRGGSGKGGRARQPCGGVQGVAEKPGKGLGPGTRSGAGDRREQRPGTRAAPTPPEQVRARAPYDPAHCRTRDPLIPKMQKGPILPLCRPPPPPPPPCGTPIRLPRHSPASLPSWFPRAHLTLHLPPYCLSPGAPMARPR